MPGSAIAVTCQLRSGEKRTARFTDTMRIGRDPGNHLCLPNDLVSRHHAELHRQGTQWWVRDLGSSNGTFLNGRRVDHAPLPANATLQFGAQGPVIWVELVGAAEHPSIPVQPAPAARPEPPALSITCQLDDGAKRTARFTDTVRIGRDDACTVRLKHDAVSRCHAEIRHDGTRWVARDLGSSNGLFLDGLRISEAPLPANATLQIGVAGPCLWLSVEGAQTTQVGGAPEAPAAASAPAPESLTEIARHYLAGSSDREVGEHTMMVRRAFQQVKKQQSRRYLSVLSVVGVLLLSSVAVGVYQYLKLQKAHEVAIEIFYSMKTVSLQVAKIEGMLQNSADGKQLQEVASKREQLVALERQYDDFLEEFGILGEDMSEEDRLIFKVARIFGECELTMPKGFVQEVKAYIQKWKSSRRLETAMEKIRTNGHAATIYQAMLANHMPPQFLYLALQESSFNHAAVGPPTRFGIAKGIWQFIPATAREYGLRTGPLVELPEYDPRDERFNFELATRAAARFIRDIYNTDAQASALLVMASYNWGPGNILERIRKMPENPRERNFWKLLEQHKIPKETYDYVFYIFSAAVIGENPRLFGFDFDNPLNQAIQ